VQRLEARRRIAHDVGVEQRVAGHHVVSVEKGLEQFVGQIIVLHTNTQIHNK
jgi:hypothetical protein